jgi:hypothetical protein
VAEVALTLLLFLLAGYALYAAGQFALYGSLQPSGWLASGLPGVAFGLVASFFAIWACGTLSLDVVRRVFWLLKDWLRKRRDLKEALSRALLSETPDEPRHYAGPLFLPLF